MPRPPSSLLFLCLFLSIGLAAPSVPTTPKPTASHCDCRCCHHTISGTVECPSPPKSIMLPSTASCDSVPRTSRDPTVCSRAMCIDHFPSLCPPQQFLEHECKSANGLWDYLPLISVTIALLSLALATSCFLRRASPPDTIPDPYKREPLPLSDASQPLLSRPPRYSDPPLEILNLSPRGDYSQLVRAHTMPSRSHPSPPFRSLNPVPHPSNSPPLTRGIPPIVSLPPQSPRPDVPRRLASMPLPPLAPERKSSHDIT